MRSGLVVIGTVIAALGIGLIATLVALTGGASSSSQISFADPSLNGHANQSWVISSPSSGKGSVAVSWTSSAPANVTLSPVPTCLVPTGPCPVGPAVLSWTMAASGKGSVPSPNASSYLLVVTNPGAAALRFSAAVSVSSPSGSTFPMWILIVIVSSGTALLVIGGIALFLGLFLPGGVYRKADHGIVAIRHPSLPPEESDFANDPGTPRPP